MLLTVTELSLTMYAHMRMRMCKRITFYRIANTTVINYIFSNSFFFLSKKKKKKSFHMTLRNDHCNRKYIIRPIPFTFIFESDEVLLSLFTVKQPSYALRELKWLG